MADEAGDSQPGAVTRVNTTNPGNTASFPIESYGSVGRQVLALPSGYLVEMATEVIQFSEEGLPMGPIIRGEIEATSMAFHEPSKLLAVASDTTSADDTTIAGIQVLRNNA